jgi:tRNA(fMet)-specific endonuclease VapC
MGVILDTTVFIAAERGRFDMSGFLESLGETGVALAAVTAGELLFGFERATDPGIRARRGAFIEAILEAVPTAPFGLAEARRHAALWAELARRLATLNRGEFERAPGLSLVELDSFLMDR